MPLTTVCKVKSATVKESLTVHDRMLWEECNYGATGQGIGPSARQLLNMTNPVVPVLFVVAETIFKNSVPKTSSGRL